MTLWGPKTTKRKASKVLNTLLLKNDGKQGVAIEENSSGGEFLDNTATSYNNNNNNNKQHLANSSQNRKAKHSNTGPRKKRNKQRQQPSILPNLDDEGFRVFCLWQRQASFGGSKHSPRNSGENISLQELSKHWESLSSHEHQAYIHLASLLITSSQNQNIHQGRLSDSINQDEDQANNNSDDDNDDDDDESNWRASV